LDSQGYCREPCRTHSGTQHSRPGNRL